MASRLPRCPLVPAALIGQLGVDRRFARQSLGSALLFDAITRATNADPAVFALIVDTLDVGAAKFYQHFGF